MLESALKTIHLDDDFLRYVLTASSINQGLYLVLDNALLLHSLGVIKLKRYEQLNEWSNKFWLFSTILCLARDIYELHNQLDANLARLKEQRTSFRLSNGNIVSSNDANNIKRNKIKFILKQLNLLLISNPNLTLDTIKNLFDIVLPLSFLKFINVSAGTQGFCGVVSSLLGLLVVWDSKYKLTP